MKTTTTTTTKTAKKKNQRTELTLKSAPSSGSVASAKSNGSSSNGHSSRGHASNGHSSNGKLSNGHAHSNGHPKPVIVKDRPRNHHSNGEGDDVSVASSLSDDVLVVKTQSPPWKKTFDYIADQAFNVAGAAYLLSMFAMGRYFINTQTDIDFLGELKSSIELMVFHKRGVPFFGSLLFLLALRWIINNWFFPLVLNGIYGGTNVKYTAHYCEWLFDAIKNTILFAMGLYVAWDSDWFPRPTAEHYLLWYPRQGGTIFDPDGEIIPTKDIALEVIGHLEITVDFVALLTLCYDTLAEYLEKRAQIRRGHDETQATTTTSFAEDFVHHTGVVFGALFLYITAKDNCNSIAIIVLLGQFNDMCEFAALTLGLCKVWVLERVVTPLLCVFWTASLFYVWPAALIPIFLEAIPTEISLDERLVLEMTLYQFGSLFIASLFWAMHMFWLYKGLLFLYRYNIGVYFQERRLKKAKKNGEKIAPKSIVPMYGRTSCIATGSVLPATKEE